MGGISGRLRKYRKERRMSQEEMADCIGMSRTGYADLEKDGHGKTFDKLPQMAKVLGCRIDDLFPEMDGYEPSVKKRSANIDDDGLDDLEL